MGLTVRPRDGYMGELATALREALADATVFPDPELGWGSDDFVRARLQTHASEVVLTRRILQWDPVVRAAAGRNDCAAAYFASHLPSEMLPRLASARDKVEQRFKTGDGMIRAEYVIAVASNE